MANLRVTDLGEISAPANNDVVHVIDVSDASQDAAGSSKKIQLGNLNPYTVIRRPTNGGFATATFARYFPFSVWRDSSGRIQTNFDWRSWAPNPAFYAANAATYYVSTTGSDSNTGASWAQAFFSINKAIAVGNAAAVPYLVYAAAGLYPFGASFGSYSGTTIPSQPCAFIAVGGRVVSSQSINTFSSTLLTGTTYQIASIVGGTSKTQICADTANLDEYGDYTQLTLATSLVSCEATPGTWFKDSSLVYVNRADAAQPTTSNTRFFFNSQIAASSTTSGNMYVEGFDFEGGEDYPMNLHGNAAGRMVFKECSFKWSSSATPTTDVNCGIYDVDGAAFINCTSAHGQNDGFAAHQANSKNPFVIWINCISHHNGSPTSTSSNAITTHDGIKSVSINGAYWSCQGGQSAHVLAGTQHWSVGDVCHSSLGDLSQGGTAPPSDWFANQSTASIWVDSGVSAPGNTNPSGYYSLYTDATGGSDTANIYYRNSKLAAGIGTNCTPY